MTRPLTAALLLCLLTPALAGARSPAPPPAARQGVGVGTSYAPGNMDRVIRVRLAQGYPMRADVPHISLPDCRLIGYTVWVRAKATSGAQWSAWQETQVADCSQAVDWGWHTLNGARVWAELSYNLAARWGLRGRFVVEVRW